VVIIKINDTPPKNLSLLLSDNSVKKVFHHAMFDLRFMNYHWKVISSNIACTKIASKLIDIKNINKHSLKSLLKQYLGVAIDKNEQLSNWMSNSLTEKQISYAANDVIYLLPLLGILEKELKDVRLLKLAYLCFAHIPTRVELEILGYDDIYAYSTTSQLPTVKTKNI